jgi:putative transposase
MKYDPERHHRRSIRLRGYDYSQAGAYFLTICTQDRACLFGDVMDGEMQLNDAGKMIHAEWDALAQRFPNVALDAFVVMPNHVHGVIILVGAGTRPAPMQAPAPAPMQAPAPAQKGDHEGRPYDGDLDEASGVGATTRVAPTVGEIIGAYKSITTVLYTRGVKQFGWPAFRARLWQRNYYEHIIRNENEWTHIQEYIANNPMQWELDRENPNFVGAGFKPAPTGNEPWRI